MPKFSANLRFSSPNCRSSIASPRRRRRASRASNTCRPIEQTRPIWPRACSDNGLEPVLHNLPAGDWARGRARHCDPARPRRGISRRRRQGDRLCDRRSRCGMNCLVGLRRRASTRTSAAQRRWSTICLCGGRTGDGEESGCSSSRSTRRDIPGFFLNRPSQALDSSTKSDRTTCILQYDIYHMQIMEGDLGGTIEANLPRIAPHPARRQSRPPRAGHRRDQLSVPVRPARRDRLHRLDRLRIQAARRPPTPASAG